MDDYEALVRLYDLAKKSRKSDSIKTIGINKFPNSSLAQMELVKEFQSAKSVDRKIEIYRDFQEQIGIRNNLSDYMVRSIALTFGEKGHYQNLRRYADLIENKTFAASLFNGVAWKLAEDEQDFAEAEELAKKSIELINIEKESPFKPSLYSMRQYKEQLNEDLNHYRDTYALINYKMGNIRKAVEVQQKAIGENSPPDANTRYVKYLFEDQQYKKAQGEAQNFISLNRGSEEMENLLKKSYTKIYGDLDGFHEKLDSIKILAMEKVKGELAQLRKVSKAPDFRLKDLARNEVHLDNLKGKTVVLDFWATWCGPCKASFPGMQKALDKFGEKDDVVFLFFNIMDNMPNRAAAVQKYIENSGYTFHVLLDIKTGPENRAYEMAKAYGINGIPTKVIIGPDGNIQFKIVVYGGNNEKMVEEIGLMIEMSKSNSLKEDSV